MGVFPPYPERLQETHLNPPNPSPDTDRLWADTEKTMRLILGRGGRFVPRPAPTAGRGRSPLSEEAPPDLQTGNIRHERALRALAKEMKRLITEDKRRGLDV